MWAYYKDGEVSLIAAPGATDEYMWGDKTKKFIRCSNCGCVMQWKNLDPGPGSWTGVNARNFEPAALGSVRIRLLDGADSWKFVG